MTLQNCRNLRVVVLALALAFVPAFSWAARQQAALPPPPGAAAVPAVNAEQTPAQLQDLVAPIALYPDPMVAQILAAATYPSQVADADGFLHQHASLQGPALASVVNQQDWDSSVKALTEYPAVLDNLNQNLSWTSSLGDAYINQPDDVMTAIQTLRRQARAAGTLRSTSQQTVTVASDGTIDIEPASPDTVYVPEYNCWALFGIPPWPGYIFPFGYGGSGFYFSAGFPLGFYAGFGWGWGGWGADWGGHRILFGRAPYYSHSPAFFDHRAYRTPNVARYRGRAPVRPGGQNRAPARGAPPARASRGFAPRSGAATGTRSGAFSGFNRGAVSAGNAMRGRASMGGGRPGGGGHPGGRGHI